MEFKPSISSNGAKKSVSFRAGAGAEGDIVAFKAMFMGGRPEEDDPESRVGAVAPPARSGSLLAPLELEVSRLTRLLDFPLFSPDGTEEVAAAC